MTSVGIPDAQRTQPSRATSAPPGRWFLLRSSLASCVRSQKKQAAEQRSRMGTGSGPGGGQHCDDGDSELAVTRREDCLRAPPPPTGHTLSTSTHSLLLQAHSSAANTTSSLGPPADRSVHESVLSAPRSIRASFAAQAQESQARGPPPQVDCGLPRQRLPPPHARTLSPGSAGHLQKLGKGLSDEK